MQMVPSADGSNKYAMAVFSLLQFTPMPGALNASEVQALTQSRALNSISYSIITLWVLEIIFTFDKEIIYIWRRSWSPFRICFLCCRYFAIVPALLILIPPAPNNTYCEFLEWYIGFIIIIFSLLPSSGLLAIRLAKLYDSASMRITLTLLVLIETSSQVGTVMSVLPKVRSTYNPVTRACATNVSKSLWLSKSLIMVPYMILLCVYIGIAWRAFIRHCREKAFLYRVGAVRENFAPLYILFIRDGVVCYIANFLGVVVGFLMLTAFPSTNLLTFAGPVVIVGITSISCCRLALLLHGDAKHAIGVYQSDTSEIRLSA